MQSGPMIPLDDLVDEWSEWRQGHGKATTILKGISGISSAIASSLIIWMILRSHKGLSTTQHRLLFGLSIADILHSLTWSTFNAMAPSDDSYMLWNARGNESSCTAQGFLSALGQDVALFYNCSLNFYYLAVIKFEKSDDYIRTKMEPFLHGVPIVASLSYTIYLLVGDHYNNDGSGFGFCNSPYHYPPHCRGFEDGEIRDGFDIPCGRGRNGTLLAFILHVIIVIVPPIVMGVSLGMIHRIVSKQEKKLAQYGVGALRTNLQQLPTGDIRVDHSSAAAAADVHCRVKRHLSALKSMLSRRLTKATPKVRSNNSQQNQSRAVMRKAYAYSIAYLLTWVFPFVNTALGVSGSMNIIVWYLTAIFMPLQGLWNFLIYIHPKVINAKKSKRDNLSWCGAFAKAFWSKGAGGDGKKRKGNATKTTHSGDNRPDKKKKGRCFHKKLTSKSNPRHLVPGELEGEKCELQPLDCVNYNTSSGFTQVSTYASNTMEETKLGHNLARNKSVEGRE